MRLSLSTLSQIPPDVARFTYDRDAQKTGIVHFGIGAFHRAHQAWYTDACMNAGERDWMISGVSLRSEAVAKQLNPQDGLYSLTERSGGEAAARIVGAVREVLVAHEANAIAARLAAPECRIASFTVTEKGYCRGEDGSLDLASSSIPQLAALGGGYQAHTRLDMWLVELGYQGQVADRLVLGLALGAMGTFASTTSITAVDGAPTNTAILGSAATQADAALEKYGIVPTLTLRLGFDLI